MHDAEDPAGHVEDIELELVGEVERLAAKRGVAAELLGEEEIRPGAVLHVEVVADQRPVGADDGPLATKHGADRSRHQAIPVEVAPAVEIAAAGHRRPADRT